MFIFQKMADKNSMEKSLREYTRWAGQTLPQDLKKELKEIEKDPNAIYDRFCRDLTFGTSGLRGKMGVGPNMINSIVLKRATDGVIDYLRSKHLNPQVIISYDTRINSMEYAEGVAEELATNGISVKIFAEPTPVPVLSFAIRELKADCGIMITASHNPKEYNGYKVYDHCGNQIDDRKARAVEDYINKREYFENGTASAKAEIPAEIKILDDKVKNAYFKALRENILFWDEETKARKALSDLEVVYTPLNGTGRDYVMEVAKSLGIRKIKMVEEQSFWDGNFPTCPSPNPEYDQVFLLAKEKYCDEKTDIIVATDPDSDRMGVMARDNSEEGKGLFKRLTGNQTGLLMLDYICYCHSKGKGGRFLDENKTVYKSYVSSPLAEDIARSYGITIKNVPTGFKNIAAEIEKLKNQGRENDFLFGFEESQGYLYGNYTRDKDGALAVQMICLLAACLKEQGKTLFDQIEDIQKRYGYTKSLVTSVDFNSEMDRKNIDVLMEKLFDGKLQNLMGQEISHDFQHKENNMYRGILPEGHQVIIRPSGTEMKVKIYIYARGKTSQEAEEKTRLLADEIKAFINCEQL